MQIMAGHWRREYHARKLTQVVRSAAAIIRAERLAGNSTIISPGFSANDGFVGDGLAVDERGQIDQF
jgi:hypothetical protein